MPIRTLFDKGVRAFLAEAETQLGDPWCLIHIPKTAGTSFKSEVNEQFRYRNIYLTADEYHQVSNGHLSYHQALAAKLAASRDDVRSGEINFLSGHLQYAAIQATLPRFDRLRLMTFLRDPVDRVISDYRYCLSSAFPNHRDFAAKYPSIEAYLVEAGEMNKMFAYLCADYHEEPVRLALRMEHSFAFVGLVEQYESWRRLFWATNRIDVPPAKRENVTANASASRSDFEPFRKAISEANAKDVAIYTHFAERARRVNFDQL